MDTPSVSKTDPLDDGSFACNKIGMEKNVIQRINAAEEIRMCMQSYSKDNDELNKGFKVALQNLEKRKQLKTQLQFSQRKLKLCKKKLFRNRLKLQREHRVALSCTPPAKTPLQHLKYMKFLLRTKLF